MTANSSIVLGGGCFWCLDAAFRRLRGVTGVTSGYAGGGTEDPSYEQVMTGKTGHAEVVQVEFDPEELPLADLLDIYFALHDPTTRDRQGSDVGPQYRSVVLYDSAEQQAAAEEAVARAAAVWPDPLVTEVVPLSKFYPAENDHQDFFAQNPENQYCRVVINPKLAKLRAEFADRLKESAE